MSTSRIYCIEFLLIFFLLAISVYLQFVDGVMPCPLCTLQRLTFALLGILFLIGIFASRKEIGKIIISLFCLMFSLLGILLAGRQIWLQTYPSANGNECGVSLQYMLQVLPVGQVMEKVLTGSAECTQRGWEFLHLNMAEWAFSWFLLFLLISFYVAFFKNKRPG